MHSDWSFESQLSEALMTRDVELPQRLSKLRTTQQPPWEFI